jgi:hypothetical protein
MKDFLKQIYKSELKLKIDSFIEKNFIYIIMNAKKGDKYYIVKVDKNLLPFIDEIKKEFINIFDDCKIYSEEESIIIDWS